MKCDICGNKEAVCLADIESTKMNVCQDCSSLGKTIKRLSSNYQQRKETKKEPLPYAVNPYAVNKSEEIIQIIVDDCGKLVKTAREKRGLKQEELAKLLHEKESTLHNIEAGKFKPRFEVARKLEKALNIKLVEYHEEKSQGRKVSASEGLTIGDLIKIKKKN